MKKLFVGLLVSSVSLAASATPVSTKITRNLDIVLPCVGSEVNLNATPAVNVYTDTYGLRVENFGTNQVFIEGNELIIQASSGDTTVVGTLNQTPTCEYSTDFQEYRPSWVNVKISSAIDITLTADDKAVSLKVADPAIPHDYNMNWVR